MLRCSDVLDELQLCNGLLVKSGQELITIVQPAADKHINQFLTRNKVLNKTYLAKSVSCSLRPFLLDTKK